MTMAVRMLRSFYPLRLQLLRCMTGLGNKYNSRMAAGGEEHRKIDLTGMRREYKNGHETFLEGHLVSLDPMRQFEAWLEEAIRHDSVYEANSMALATADKSGRPSVRMVLLKAYDDGGFKFFTNYRSRKAQDLLENPHASLLFFWDKLNKQIRIEGRVEKLPASESDAYFRSRPLHSQVGALVSEQQSAPIPSRQYLEEREAQLKQQYEGQTSIACPEWWGGFRVVPEVIEFWQGQSTRLHDRIVFRRPGEGEDTDTGLTHKALNGWVYERLSP